MTGISDWIATGERNVAIEYDIETNPLQILTDSVVGSEDLIRVGFLSEDSVGGAVHVKFTDPHQYRIGWCIQPDWVTFTNMPVEDTRVWTITKTATSLVLVCNGVEIFNYLFSESTNSDCVLQWSGDMVTIKFMSTTYGVDTASDKYRAKPTGRLSLMLSLKSSFKAYLHIQDVFS